MPNNDIFDKLIISSPNGGGLYFICEGNPVKLDNFYSTGLSVNGRKLIRGFQDSGVTIYDGSNGYEIDNKVMGFDDVHDVLIDGEFYYLVGTSGNEVVKVSAFGKELQRWVFPGEIDSMHINCLAKWNGAIVFSAFGDFSIGYDYKGKSLGSGFVQDLHSGQRLITDLSQPHSLVSVNENLILASSEAMEIVEYGPSCNVLRRKQFDGYTRGICVLGDIVYVGLSCSRNIEHSGVDNACVLAIEKTSWNEIGRLQLPCSEIYQIQSLGSQNDSIYLLTSIVSASSSKSEKALAVRDCQVADLAQAVSDRDGEIASLNQSISERDGQIVGLTQAVSDRDGEIASLNQSITERDGQIVGLTQAVSDRDGEIASLSQFISERDGQIVGLTQAVSDRDGEIASLNQSITDITNSLFWRVTFPARWGLSLFKRKPLTEVS